MTGGPDPAAGEASEGASSPAAAPALDRAAGDGRSRAFPCKACGADLVFPPGTALLRCPYCASEEVIPLSEQAIREYAFSDRLPTGKPTGLGGDTAFTTLECAACGAGIDVPPSTAVRPCPYCGGTLVDRGAAAELTRPEALIPFAITGDQAEAAVRRWMAGLWFAPSDLRRAITLEAFTALYLPYWTFDSHTCSHYRGEAGFHYTVRVGSGKNARTVRKTRWEARSGVHEQFFDDVLVCGGEFTDWRSGYRLDALRAYDVSYLAGHHAGRYSRDAQACWPRARGEIDSALHDACRRRIGGDTQRDVQVRTAHRGITCKLVLLPRYQAGFRYRGRQFPLMVNGQSGEVHGDRPWSRMKIALAVIAGLLALALVALAIAYARR